MSFKFRGIDLSKTAFNLQELKVAITKIKLYSSSFYSADDFGIDADEIWDIINHKLIPLDVEIDALLKTA